MPVLIFFSAGHLDARRRHRGALIHERLVSLLIIHASTLCTVRRHHQMLGLVRGVLDLHSGI